MINNIKLIASAATELQKIVAMVQATNAMIDAMPTDHGMFDEELAEMRDLRRQMMEKEMKAEHLFKLCVGGADTAPEVWCYREECAKLYHKVMWYADTEWRRDHEAGIEFDPHAPQPF